MHRRKFVKSSGLIAGGLAINNLANAQGSENNQSAEAATFKLNYAPHIGMFKNHAGDDPVAQLHFMADKGFTAFEDNEMKNRPVELQLKMANAIKERGITMGVFVAHKIYWQEGNLASGNEEKRAEFLADIKNSVAVAKRVNAKWMTVVPGTKAFRLDEGYQTANVIETLKQASAILEPHGLTMVLEPLNFRDHPKLFLTKAAQAYQICRAVGSPSCKILFDIYHQQIQEGNLIPNIDKCWDEIAYFQIGDNPGRNEPTTGEINYRNVFKHIYDKGFKGVMGMEHGNSKEGKAGELAVINAYKFSDSF